MQKQTRMMLVIFMAIFMTISFIPAKALNIAASTTTSQITLTISFPTPTITQTENQHTIEMPSLPQTSTAGEPILPYKTVRILIPQGKEAQSITVTPGNRRLLEGKFNIEYGRTPTPVGYEPSALDKPNPEIYNSEEPFPRTPFSHVLKQYLKGYKILLVTLGPVQYTPKIGEVAYFETMTITVNLETSKTSSASPLRNLPQDKATIQDTVENPEALKTYATQPQPMSVDPEESYSYVVITDGSLSSSFQPLIDLKIGKGLTATTVLIEDILNDPDYFSNGIFGDGIGSPGFNDTAARVRNFIRDAYQNWETEYVLLGGDTAIIPTRGVYGFVNTDPPTVDQNMPCDMYFGTLDGSWNNDNDTIFGEEAYDPESPSPEQGMNGEEADFFAEVYIGRATVRTPEEVGNFVSKTLWYEQSTDDNYFKKAVMAGEKLDDETQAGNGKDRVTEIIPQYTTIRLYDRDRTYSRDAVVNAINQGTHILNHDGHSNTDTLMGMSTTDVDTMITNTEYFLGYSLGCYAAAIDLDCNIEHYIFNPHGAFAFIGNSRYGWYLPGTMLGAGDRFDRAFYTVLNNTVQNLGKALQLSKEGFAGATSDSRWTYFVLNLLGDPEIEIVTEIMAPTAEFDTNPSADRMSSPVVKGKIDLVGTAKRGTAFGATFSNFTIEFGYGRTPSSWQTIGIELVENGQTETTNGLLGTWDTNLVTPAVCTLKLRVTDQNGAVGEDRWIVEVKAMPAIHVLPELINTQEGLTFTTSFTITSPGDLYGLDLQVKWDPTLLGYVSHALYIPANDYSWGVLFKPVQISKNQVDEVAGTYTVTAKSQSPANAFTRDGTVFNMTFLAKATGTCNMEIYASSLTDPSDQPIAHNRWNATVNIEAGVHDGAVTNILRSKTVVGQGKTVKVNVTIANEGTFSENFEATAYANGIAIGSAQVFINGQKSDNATIVWNTAGWTYGSYVISANVTLIEGETDTSDNIMSDGDISVTIAGDVDGNYNVNIFDIVKIAGVYGAKWPNLNYVPNCDIDGNGEINIFDIVMAAGNYGKSA